MLGLFVVMYEPWVLDVKLDTLHLDAEDPDRPYAETVKTNSSKHNRTGFAMIQLIQSTTCLREFFNEYLDDHTSSAQHYSTRWCCDRHPGSDFKLATFFLGEIYTSQLSSEAEAPAATKHKRVQYRAREDRPNLLDTLEAWRCEAHIQDPYRSVRPITWICDDDELDLLSKTHPSKIGSAQDIVDLLQETAEWGIEFGQQLFDVIDQFDRARGERAFDAACLAK
ncbi:hypothetical protein J3R83DRAFT_4610 [Lanmaoa asiatica]|nr:hypothetical protein J3R83DRAFT_4610 [Lanmaoa asiatica]